MVSAIQFGWCGSAVLGGLLSDRHSYGYTFFITAVLQGSGSLLLLLIAPLVPSEAKDEDNESSKHVKRNKSKSPPLNSSRAKHGDSIYEDTRAPVYEDTFAPVNKALRSIDDESLISV